MHNNHVEIVKLLLQDKLADPSIYSNLYVKWINGKATLMNPLNPYNYPIKWAIAHDHIDIVELLLNDPSIDPSADNNWAFRKAVQNRHTEVVKLLLINPRVDPSANDNEAIKQAAAKGHRKIVKLLLKDPHIKNPATNYQDIIEEAMVQDQIVIVKLLIEKNRKSSLGIDENLVLKWASGRKHAELVELLLENKKINPKYAIMQPLKKERL